MTTPKSEYSEIEATKLRERVITCAKGHTKSSIELARGLFEACYGTVKKDGVDIKLTLHWGHDTFDEYAEHEVGLHGGTARSYVHTYDELFVRRQFDEGVLPDSMTKLRALAKISRRLRDAREVRSWVAKANSLGPCQFEAEIEEVFGDGRVRRKTVSFDYKWTKVAALVKALNAAKEHYSVSSRADALERIVADFNERTREGAPATARKRSA